MRKQAAGGGSRAFFRTIRGKLTVLGVFLVAVILGTAVYILVAVPLQALRTERPLVQSAGTATAVGMAEGVQYAEAAVARLAAQPGMAGEASLAAGGDAGARAGLDREEAELADQPGIGSAAAVAPAGAVLPAAGPAPTPAEVLLARRAWAAGRVQYGAPYLAGKRVWAALAVPLGPGGAQVALLDLSALAGKVEARLTAGPQHLPGFALVTAGGTILYDPSGTGLGRKIANGRVLALLRSHPSGRVYVGAFYARNARQRMLGNFDPLAGVGYRLDVLTGEPPPPVDRTLPLLLALAALVTAGAVVRLGGHDLNRPLREAVAAARSFGRGDLAARIPAQRDAEFQDLATAFNAAAQARSEVSRVEGLLARAQEDLAEAGTAEMALRTVAEFACLILGAKLAVIMTEDPDQRLVPRVVWGEAAALAKGLCVPIRAEAPEGHLPCAVAFREGKFVAAGLDPPYPAGVDPSLACRPAASIGLRFIMCFPLLHQGRKLGVLNCFAPAAPPPVAAQEATQALALTAAAALHGMTLREETLLSMAAALEARDYETQAHARRVAMYAQRLAEECGVCDSEQVQYIRWGALLHDVGKIGLPDAVLQKPGPLNSAEWRQVHRHPEIGYGLVRGLEFLGLAREIVLHHHEHFDGAGYPGGLQGEAIPFGARIFAVADAFDAMTSDRPYRRACSFGEAREELRRSAGTQLDPGMVDAFCRIPRREWEELRRQAEAGFFFRFRTAGAAG